MVIPCLVGLCMFCKTQACFQRLHKPCEHSATDFLLPFRLSVFEVLSWHTWKSTFPICVPIPLTTFAIRSNNISSILYPLQNKFLHFPSHSGYRSHLLSLQITVSHKEGIWEVAYLQQTPKSPLHLLFSQGIIQKEKLAYVRGKKVLEITHFNPAEGLSKLI